MRERYKGGQNKREGGGGGGESKLSTDRGIQKTTVYRKMIKRILNFMF